MVTELKGNRPVEMLRIWNRCVERATRDGLETMARWTRMGTWISHSTIIGDHEIRRKICSYGMAISIKQSIRCTWDGAH